jgi:hypothetical protein
MSKRLQALEMVIQTLEEISSEMDTREETCECCGRVARSNWDQYHIANHLSSAVTRVEKAVRGLRREYLSKGEMS